MLWHYVLVSLFACTSAFSLRVKASHEPEKVKTRMSWWAEGEPLPPTDKYVLFTYDVSGLNNVRIGWEMTALVAQLTNRTLVLPPAHKIDHLDKGGNPLFYQLHVTPDGWSTKVEDIINLKQLKSQVPTLTAEEFLLHTGQDWRTIEADESLGVRVHEEGCKFSQWKNMTDKFLFMPGARRAGFGCGDWAQKGGPSMDSGLRKVMTDDNWALLTHGFVYRDDIVSLAARFVSAMGIFEYNSLHVRVGDFQDQYRDQLVSFEGITTNWHDLFTSLPTLFVSTDEPDKLKDASRLLPNTRVVTFDSLAEHDPEIAAMRGLYSAERWFKMRGPIEELICTFSHTFVGTGLSTFSGHINRMRLHARAPVTEVLLAHRPKPLNSDGNAWKAEETGRMMPLSRNHGDTFLLQMQPRSGLNSFFHRFTSWFSH